MNFGIKEGITINKLRTIIYIILIIALTSLGIIGILNKKTDYQKPTQEKPNEIVIQDKNLEDSNYELQVHINTDKKCTSTDCQKLAIIKTKTQNAKVLNIKNYANYILIYDETIKLIDINNNSIENINLNYSRLNTYNINLEDESKDEYENENKKILSIISYSINQVEYYDYKTKQNTFSEEFTNIEKIEDYYLGTDEQGKINLLNIKGELLFTIKEKINEKSVKNITSSEKYIHIEYINNKSELTYLTYDKDGKFISTISGNFTNINLSQNEIYAYATDKLMIYNINGKLMRTLNLKEYEISYTYESIIIAVKNKNIVLINLKTNEEKEIAELDDREIIEISYKQTGQHPSNKNKLGIYITLKNDENTIEIVYNIDSKKVETFDLI